MNKKFYLPMIGAAVVGLAVAFLLLFQSLTRNPSPQPSPTQQQVSGSQEEQELTQMISNAFTGESSVKCMYDTDDADGVVFVKNGRLRIDTVGGEAPAGVLIYKDDSVWAWELGAESGYLIENLSQYQGGVLPEEYQVDSERIQSEISDKKPVCAEEAVDDSVFIPPTDVTFEAFMPPSQGGVPQVPEGIEIPEGYSLPEGFTLPEGYTLPNQ